MRKGLSRRDFLGSAAVAAALAPARLGAAPPDSSLRPVLRGEDLVKRAAPDADSIIAAAGLKGDVAYAVADAATGTWLECRNETLGTPPASTAKAITALYAMETLGVEHRFETRLLTGGAVEDGVVKGDLWLVGGGDPTLDTDALADMAAKLRAQGIVRVEGDFYVHESALPVVARIDPEQPDQVGYNPGVSALALNYNRVHFEWTRGASGAYGVTMQGRSERYRPDVAMAVMQVRQRKAPVYTYEDRDGRDYWTVASGALGKGGSRWLPVRKPGLYAGEVFGALAKAEGIALGRPRMTQELPDDPRVLVARSSAPLRDILREMLRYSTNLTAEMVGLAASVARRGTVADLRASAAEMNAWARERLGMTAPALVDHSGLGDDSKMTALDMARAMVRARDAGLRPILRRFTLRDGQGRPMPDHPVEVAAKTGTLNFVSGLVGYMQGRDGRLLAFAILAAEPKVRATIRREDREGPPGARGWNGRAKRVQQALIERWDVLYDA